MDMGRGSGVWFIALFLIIPIPANIDPPLSPEGEYEVEFGRVVVSLDWRNLELEGLHPLRQSSPTSILVWGATKGAPEPAIYRGHLENTASYRVVLEPGLPLKAQMWVFDVISSFGNTSYLFQPLDESMLSPVLLFTTEINFDQWWPEIEMTHGIRWVEPVLETEGRNEVSASILQHGQLEGWPSWNLGLDGEGVVIAAADSGIDRDHACFRQATAEGEAGSEINNATGTPGINHRKIIALNETIDDWDELGQDDYRHGTHIAGSLVCHIVWNQAAEMNGDWDNATPGDGTSLSYRSKLVFEDVVDDDDWKVPDVDELFWEAARYGAVIRSDSWGDPTSNYTVRTEWFDTWLHQVPWSVAFVAPGNTGGEILEPANGHNVVSVGVAAHDGTQDLWTMTPREAATTGRQGVLLVVPGEDIVSAMADGQHKSYNDGMRPSTGSSMATPQAASAAAIVQQMVQDGWLSGNEERVITSAMSLRPDWYMGMNTNLSHGNIALAQGFTPSGSMLRALLALSAESLEGGRQVSEILGPAPDDQQGWGRVNLSNLVDFAEIEYSLENSTVDPSPHTWIHDSFRYDGDWFNLVDSWVDDDPLTGVAKASWRGEGAAGPFLSTGENFSWKFNVVPGSDFRAHLSWTSAPGLESFDDLDLVVMTDNGRTYLGNDFLDSGIADSNDAVEGVIIPSLELKGVEIIEIKVEANHVSAGPNEGVIGLMGDRIGFALAVDGVERSSVDVLSVWSVMDDTRGSGLPDLLVACFITVPIAFAIAFVIDARRVSYQSENYGSMTKGQPSNHGVDSLDPAEAPTLGDCDE